jgi:hypothetical protein
MLVLYVDDAGIAAKSKEVIDKFMQDLRDLKFEVDIEDDFTSYLGIGIEKLPDGTKRMTQTGLIKKILAACKMENCNGRDLPTTQTALGSDPDGELYNHLEFHYSSIVGMLLYLSNNTRPDITYAVSQVARFTNKPKVSHAKAIKSIVRYLSRTADKGFDIKPDGSYDLRCWVDADFAGLHNMEPEQTKTSAKSRYGYIVSFAGVPLIWKSQLIDEICLSTMHAEYVGLSNAVRILIPLTTQVKEVLKFLKLPSDEDVKMHCKLFEDNQGAFLLATNQRVSARSKYFNVKYHFFWQFVYHKEKNPSGWLIIEKCPTEEQRADYLTKGLSKVLHEANRLSVQGF